MVLVVLWVLPVPVVVGDLVYNLEFGMECLVYRVVVVVVMSLVLLQLGVSYGGQDVVAYADRIKINKMKFKINIDLVGIRWNEYNYVLATGDLFLELRYF
jgi:hypothetical protein